MTGELSTGEQVGEAGSGGNACGKSKQVKQEGVGRGTGDSSMEQESIWCVSDDRKEK